MSESTKQYPEWQKAFRVAQAERDNQIAIEDAIKRDKEAEQARKTGGNLAKALMHFGFYLETPPETNEVVIDGFTFCLSSGANYSVGENADGKEWFRFALRVSKPTPGRYADDDQIRYRHIGVDTTSHDFKNVGWDHYLVELADAFDEIDADIAFDLERQAEYMKRQEERRLNPSAEHESDEQKLMKLLRAIIRDEMQRELEY